MKKVNEHIDPVVKKTLEAFDGIEKASPKPYFYSRLSARMQPAKGLRESLSQLKPVWIKVIVSIVAFLILINAYTVSTVQKPNTASLQSVSTDALQAFIGDYYPQAPTVYNLDETINQ